MKRWRWLSRVFALLTTLAVVSWAVSACKTLVFGPFIYFTGERVPVPPESVFPANVIAGCKEPVIKLHLMCFSGLAYIQIEWLRPPGNGVICVSANPLQEPPTLKSFHINPGFLLPDFNRWDIEPGEATFYRVRMPFWVIAAIFASVTIVAFRKSRVRFKEFQCQQCGYNLTGNTSGKCPECGKPVPPPGQQPATMNAGDTLDLL